MFEIFISFERTVAILELQWTLCCWLYDIFFFYEMSIKFRLTISVTHVQLCIIYVQTEINTIAVVTTFVTSLTTLIFIRLKNFG